MARHHARADEHDGGAADQDAFDESWSTHSALSWWDEASKGAEGLVGYEASLAALASEKPSNLGRIPKYSGWLTTCKVLCSSILRLCPRARTGAQNQRGRRSLIGDQTPPSPLIGPGSNSSFPFDLDSGFFLATTRRRVTLSRTQ